MDFQEALVVYGTWYMFHEIRPEELLTYFVNFNEFGLLGRKAFVPCLALLK